MSILPLPPKDASCQTLRAASEAPNGCFYFDTYFIFSQWGLWFVSLHVQNLKG